MSRADVRAVEGIVANTINEIARGDPDAQAARIVAALGEAGYRIVPANGMEETALGSQRDKYGMEQLYRSPNGDTWFLARDPATGMAFVRHQANTPSGGQVTDIELGAFLSGARNPEHEALLRLIGNSIVDPQGANAAEEPPAVTTRREWSDPELKELGDMLVRGLPIEEIARVLGRDHGEVQDKVVEIGRACRGTSASRSEPAKVFEDRLIPGDWRVEWEDEDGGVEVTIFSGPDARERAIQYADWRYRQFVERTWPST